MTYDHVHIGYPISREKTATDLDGPNQKYLASEILELIGEGIDLVLADDQHRRTATLQAMRPRILSWIRSYRREPAP